MLSCFSSSSFKVRPSAGSQFDTFRIKAVDNRHHHALINESTASGAGSAACCGGKGDTSSCKCMTMASKSKATMWRLRAVGVFYSTSTGNSAAAADAIAEGLGTTAQDIEDIELADLKNYSSLVIGTPTWNTGAEEQRSGVYWDDVVEDVDGLDLKGKPCAVFGLGDSVSYGDYFCDAIEEVHTHFSNAGCQMVGSVDVDGYTFDDSKAVADGKFLGLALDEDNESDKSEDRINDWVAQLKKEGI